MSLISKSFLKGIALSFILVGTLVVMNPNNLLKTIIEPSQKIVLKKGTYSGKGGKYGVAVSADIIVNDKSIRLSSLTCSGGDCPSKIKDYKGCGENNSITISENYKYNSYEITGECIRTLKNDVSQISYLGVKNINNSISLLLILNISGISITMEIPLNFKPS